jgi:hypothetical protein
LAVSDKSFSRHALQTKVKEKVYGFTELIRETALDEYSYENVKSRGK